MTTNLVDLSLKRLQRAERDSIEEAQVALERGDNEATVLSGFREKYRAALRRYARLNPGPC